MFIFTPCGRTQLSRGIRSAPARRDRIIPLIYLDNAATTFPKPPSVVEEFRRASLLSAGNPGRGTHSLALAASEEIYSLREALAAFFSLEKPENVVLTFNATYALNIAISALRQPGHILISDLEHNSVRRPVAALGGSYSVFRALERENVLRDIRRKCRRDTYMIVCTQSSNTANVTLPLVEISQFCRERGIKLVIDASQGAGFYPLDFKSIAADAICVPAHKALYGIQGAGAVLFADKYRGRELRPLISGGSGVGSALLEMPTRLPERLEAGTLSVPLAAAWKEGIRVVSETGIDVICEHCSALRSYTENALLQLPDVRVYMPGAKSGSLVLFNIDGISAGEVGRELDRRGICVRSGLHCAPSAHASLGTGKDGAVRASFGAFNTLSDAEALCNAVEEIVRR